MIKYINLGLPSGTRWANRNENGFHTHPDAVKKTHGRLPTTENWEELQHHCTWTWDARRQLYTVTGPNGRHITLPACGFICCAGPCHAGEGHYWTAEEHDSSTAHNLFFNANRMLPDDTSYKILGMSIRTVKQAK